MKTYLVVHRAPGLSWATVEENWRKLADVKSATWICTYYNVERSVRFCIWQAPDRATLEKVFVDFRVAFESITEVEETSPDLWSRERWEAHLRADAEADTLGG